MAKISLVARNVRHRCHIEQTEKTNGRVRNHAERVVYRLLDPSLQKCVQRAVEVIEVAEEVVHADATELGHDGVITLRHGSDYPTVGVAVKIEHPSVVAFPGVDLFLRLRLNDRHHERKRYQRHMGSPLRD